MHDLEAQKAWLLYIIIPNANLMFYIERIII